MPVSKIPPALIRVFLVMMTVMSPVLLPINKIQFILQLKHVKIQKSYNIHKKLIVNKRYAQ